MTLSDLEWPFRGSTASASRAISAVVHKTDDDDDIDDVMQLMCVKVCGAATCTKSTRQ